MPSVIILVNVFFLDPAIAAGPNTMIWRANSLVARRHDRSNSTRLAVASLFTAANKAMSAGPFSVTNKVLAPPSGSKHDYWSVASYFWPCNVPCNHTLWQDCSRWCMPPLTYKDHKCIPATPKENLTCNQLNGLPWISHDGYPRDRDQTGKYLKGDRSRADGITLDASTLALAWWFSPQDSLSGNRYAERAALLLRTFFLNNDTKMNPNMNYAQGVPGKFDGGVGGTVDFGRLWMLLDAVRILQTQPPTSSPWKQTDRDDFRAWLAAMLEWWVYSPDGQKARNITNNIGNAYDIQAMAMASFLGNASLAADIVAHDVRRRVELQIASDGSMPKEDARSNSFGYHSGNLLQFINLAAAVNASVAVMAAAGIPVDPSAADLLHYASPGGGSILAALDWLAPYCKDNATTWPFPVTNNSGEGIATYLPRCRLVYNWASLLFARTDNRSVEYRRIAANSSTARDGYAGLPGLSTLDYTRLLYSA